MTAVSPVGNGARAPRTPCRGIGLGFEDRQGKKESQLAVGESLPRDSTIALQRVGLPHKAHGVTQEANTNEVPECRKKIISGAQKATGVSAEDVALGLAIQAAVFPVAGDGEGDP